MSKMKNLLYFIAGLLAVVCLQPSTAVASSHREAPLISNDPLADNTDLYAFKSPNNAENIVLIANYIPFEHPAGGPNWYTFGERIRYEVHVDNNTDTPGSDIIYRFEFMRENEDPTTFFNIRLGKENNKRFYTCQRSMDGGRTFQTIIEKGIVPPPNIGPRSIDNKTVGLGTTYEEQMQKGIMTASTGEKIFAGPVDDPFFVDLGIFDLGAIRTENPRDAVARFNCHSIVIEVPVATLQRFKKPASEARNILDANYVIGVYASASRQVIRTIYDGSDIGWDGEYMQVSRLGMPLTNEVIIPIGMKDRWNATKPTDDLQFAKYFSNPELALYMDDSQFGSAVPGLAPLRIQTKSLGTYDFRNGKRGLFGLKNNAALNGTALAENLFGGILLPDSTSPRAVDLLPIFYTGVPNFPPYQLATGKAGNPLAAGKPFINNWLPTLGDMLRLNMAVPATPRTSPDFSSLGLIQAAALGLTDARYNTTKTVQMIPNMDGFPNGRRLEDDVTTIELQAVGGAVLAAIGLWYDDFTPGTTTSPVTPALGRVLGFKAGPTKNDKAFRTTFPYEAEPWRGFQGPSYEGKKVETPVAFTVGVKRLACTNGDVEFEVMNADSKRPVEYSAVNVTNGWTTNPKQRVREEFFKSTTGSGKITVRARYVGDSASVVSSEYDFRKQCSTGGRLAAEPTVAPTSFAINVLGNPTNKDVVAFDLRGNAGEAMEIGVSDANGRLLTHDAFKASGNVERRSVRIGRAPGIYFLKVGTPSETRTIKLLRE